MAKMMFDEQGLNNNKVHLTFEPTKNPLGITIRKVLTHELNMSEQTIAAMFLADRLDHVQNEAYGMLKYLEDGYTVICDRYYLSSCAYHVPHVSLKWVLEAHSICTNILRPDITFFIDVSVEESLRRISLSRSTTDLFETKERLQLVRNNYLHAIEITKELDHIVIINGEQEPKAVFTDCLNALHRLQ